MENNTCTDKYFSNLSNEVKLILLKELPFTDETEKTIFTLLLIGNTSSKIANRLKLNIKDVLFDRKNLFKKIQLVESAYLIPMNNTQIETDQNDNGYCVYKLTLPNNKIYIGIGTNMESDWCNIEYYNDNQRLYRDMKKFGFDNINQEIIYSGMTYVQARKKERKLVLEYKSYSSKFGYNNVL